MRFYDDDKNITAIVVHYEILYRQQYLPVAWIGLKTIKNINNLTIKDGDNIIFYGTLQEMIEEEGLYIYYFTLKHEEFFDFDEEYNQSYKTFHTWGGKFNNKDFQWEKIIWHPNYIQNMIIINVYKNFSIKKQNIGGLKIIINHNSHINYQYNIEKSVIIFHEKINEFMEKIHKTTANINVENITYKDLMDHKEFFIYYNHYLNLHVEEKLNIIYGKPTKTIMINSQSSHLNYNKISSIDFQNINTIINHYHYYHQFKYEISFTIKKIIPIGQWIQLKYKGNFYKGIVIKSIINNDITWTNTITIKSFINFHNEIKLPIYNKNININEKYLKELWDQWNYNEEQNKINIPILNNYFTPFNHQDIIIEF